MSTGIVRDVYLYPVKGAQPDRVDYLDIDERVGVKNDRHYAIRRVSGDMSTWAPKPAFYVCMNTAQMAAERPVFVGGSNRMGGINELARDYLAGLAKRLNLEDGVKVQEADGSYNLSDTKGNYVSFLNLASVEALSNFAGIHISPHRFRMNVWLTGLEPFEELSWVDVYPGFRDIQVGTGRFRVDDACERCAAIEANPLTGTYDIPLRQILTEMMTQRGYKSPHRGVPTVMGILASPLKWVVLRRSDPVKLIS
ncbi:MAG: hypothetical protein WC050_03715 [Candidatus Paceibacterota bacterium]